MINQRIASLREKMKEKGIDALIIPSADPHQSEYVCDHWKSRAHFSGFSGSAGYLIVIDDYAALWTDSRYFIQAEEELHHSEVQLHKQKIPHAPEHVKWLCDRLNNMAVIGIEASLFSMDQFAYLEKHATSKRQSIRFVDGIIDEVWPDRPAKPSSSLYEHDVRYAGRSRDEKLALLQKDREENECDHILITALDEIAWLLNVRAWDIEFTPVALSYFLLSGQSACLYVDEQKVSDDLKEILLRSSIRLRPYEAIEEDLKSIDREDRIYIDKSKINMRLLSCIEADTFEGNSLCEMKMAIKNEVEIEQIRQVMRKDGVALVRFFRFVEANQGLSEYDLVQKVAEFRSKQEDYIGESFGAIVGWKGNGAIVHYSPDKENSASIVGQGMLLVDSGGQYLNGTTDITRTIFIGEPEQEHKESFTQVLKGNIALQTIKFPEGTSGMQLDTLARMHLWNAGKNYGHGTGHGVGFFLRVHEPPQGFATSPATSRGLGSHLTGMLSSNEPGFYRRGEYGIRIENLMISKLYEENEFGRFLCFEAVTLFPISKKLIDVSMLSKDELKWLDDYHEKVYRELYSLLSPEEENWLKEACSPLSAK